MVKRLNLSFNDNDFIKLKNKKLASGKSWENYILNNEEVN